MNKIMDLFRRAAAAAGTVFIAAKDKIFWRQAAEERQAKWRRKLAWGVIAVIVLIILGMYSATLIWPKKSANSTVANPIAEAKITVVTSGDCGKQCWDTQLFTDALTSQGIKISGQETVSVNGWWPWGKGKEIAKTYQITKVPTVIVEFTGSNQPDINKFFSPTLGAVINNKFVLTKILAPYYDLAAKKIKGLIKVTYLTDNSCPECYDIKKHETALKNLGAATDNSETIDISSAAGQALINKYKITKVPTLLISGEVSEYAILTQAWAEVGIIADDGTYVFTNLDLMGESYKDLSTGKVVKAKAAATSTAATVPATKK